MSDFSLTLGPVAFAGFELPSSITLGGRQRLAIHKLPGGLRIIDALGPDPADLAWSGIFTGPDAADRARVLDTMRVAGLDLLLAWDAFLYTIVIETFEADYRSPWWIPYRLSCTVLRDEAATLVTAALARPDHHRGPRHRRPLRHQRRNRDRGTRRHHRWHRRLHRRLRHARHHAHQPRRPNRHHRTSDPDLLRPCRRNRLRTTRRPHRRPRLHRPRRPQPRRREHLSPAMRTLTTAGGNLFRIAAEQLADATQWIRIAQLNAIADPQLSGLVVLKIPDPDPAAGGGIANQ